MSGSGFMRSAAVVGICTSVSRVLGLLREVLMGFFFGTSLAQSAFVVAFKIPNLFRRLFGEGALSAAFIPVFTKSLEKDGRDAAWSLAGKVMTLLASVLVALILVALLLITWAEHRFDFGERAAATLSLLRIMLPYTLFICLVALSMAILNSLRHFLVPAATPIVLNIVWILTLTLVLPRIGGSMDGRIVVVAWAVVIAGVIQLAVQLPILIRRGFAFRLSWDWRDVRVRRVIALMAPAALGMGVHQVNVVIDGVLAFWVADWAPAALSYSERMIYLPLGVIATAFGAVLLPVFSTHVARAEKGAILETFRGAVRSLAIIMVPAAVGLLVLAEPILRVTYMWSGGEFDEDSLLQTRRALQFYAPGLFFFSLYKVFVPVFYAQQDMRTPVRVGLAAVAINLVLNITFILTWPDGYQHAGLACSTVLSSAFSCVVLAILLRRHIGSPGWPSLLGALARIVVAAAVMGAIAWWIGHLAVISAIPGKGGQLVQVVAAVGGGMLSYLALTAMICRRELLEIISGLRSR